jgi:hypothetical protein
VQQTSKVHSTVLRNTNFKAQFTVLVMCHPTLFVSLIPSIIVDNQESPENDWCLNTKTKESYTIKYNTIQYYSWMKIFVPTVWKLSNWNPKFMTAPRFSQIFFHPWSFVCCKRRNAILHFKVHPQLCI